MKEEKNEEIEKNETQQNVEETASETEQTVAPEEEKELTLEEKLDAANNEISSLKDQL